MSILSKYIDDLKSNNVRDLGLSFAYKCRDYRLCISPTRSVLSISNGDTRWKIISDLLTYPSIEEKSLYHLIDLTNIVWDTLKYVDFRLENLQTNYYCDTNEVDITVWVKYPNLSNPLSITISYHGCTYITIRSDIYLDGIIGRSSFPEFPDLYRSGTKLYRLDQNYSEFTKELITQELSYWNIVLSSLEFDSTVLPDIKSKTSAYIDENTEELRNWLVDSGLKPLDPYTNEGRGIMAPYLNGDFYKTCTVSREDDDVNDCYFCDLIEEFKGAVSILKDKNWTWSIL